MENRRVFGIGTLLKKMMRLYITACLMMLAAAEHSGGHQVLLSCWARSPFHHDEVLIQCYGAQMTYP